MRKIILLALLMVPVFSFANRALNFNMREGKPGYEILKIRGVEVYKAPELSNLSAKDKQATIRFLDRIFFETEKYMPHTFKEFKKRGYKVMLFQENIAGNGLEFLREGQHTWDRRIDKRGTMNKSIIFIKTIDYVNIGSRRGLFYFVHEMAHFRHLALSKSYNSRILSSYKSARAQKKYIGSYTGKNHLEYFADISASFLLPRDRGWKYPRGARELKEYDPNGFKLCCELWGMEPMPPADLRGLDVVVVGGSKPPAPTKPPARKPRDIIVVQIRKPVNPILIRRAKPNLSGRYTTAHDDSPMARNEYRIIYNTIEDAEFNAYLKRNSAAIAKYKEAHDKLLDFTLKYPNWNNNLAERKMKKLKAEAQAFGNSCDQR